MRHVNYLICILFIAFILRIYNIGTNPPAAYGDEQSFAWNAWNILKTGTDEYGTPWPLQFRAFDDYKAPIPVYLLVPFLSTLGLTTFAVRLPVTLFGTATVFMVYLLVKKLFTIFSPKMSLSLIEKLGLTAAFLLSISPWHLHLSRGYFESTLSLLFLMSGLYFFVASKEKINRLIFSAFFFALTLYTYFTPRITILLLIPFLYWWGKDWLLKYKRYVVYFLIVLFLLSFPLIKLAVFDKGLSRIDKLTTATDRRLVKAVTDARNSTRSPEIIKKIVHNRPIYWLREIIQNYFEHFSLTFLYLYGDSSLRYGIGNFGMQYLIELPFLLFGLYYLYASHRKLFIFCLYWLLITPLPAAVVGKPFAVRSLAMVIPLTFFTSFGMVYVFLHLLCFRFGFVLKTGLIVFFLFSFSFYLIRYHLDYKTYAATWWGWENKAALDLAFREQENYDQIYLSNFYSGMDLAFAYYTAYDPIAFRKAKTNRIIVADGREQIQLGKFYIGSLDIDSVRIGQGVIPSKTLYIGRPEEYDSSENITAPDDGRILFKVYRTL